MNSYYDENEDEDDLILVDRENVNYICSDGHVTTVPIAINTKTEIPNQWDCQYCTKLAVKEDSEIQQIVRRSRRKYANDDNPAWTMLKERREGKKGDIELQADLDDQLKLLRSGKLKRASMM